ncbi:sulfotransferase domain-containing protein [Sulfurimonas sp. HSL1-6]|uniref:sulfotransferase domain-containing protein n=1 Tax=Thiomicrolovo immobilis TaxID=3131935 RepID=UPI0031F83864
MLPNFFIVGAPKAGTTSLYHYLSEHPEVFMSEPKEVNFFSKEEIEAQGLYYDDFKAGNLAKYEALFEDAGTAKAIGEGSVSYLFYPKTPQKLHDAIPDAKIIILLRDPVERGYSHYLMDYRLGLVSQPYEEVVHQTGNHKHKKLYYQQYVALGLYYEQVKRYLDLFGLNQVKIYFQEDLRKDTEGVIQDLYKFLKIETNTQLDLAREHNAFSMPKNALIHRLYSSRNIRKTLSALLPDAVKEIVMNRLFERKKKPQLDPELRNELVAIYRPDIEKLEALLNKDLSHWYKEQA